MCQTNTYTNISFYIVQIKFWSNCTEAQNDPIDRGSATKESRTQAVEKEEKTANMCIKRVYQDAIEK